MVKNVAENVAGESRRDRDQRSRRTRGWIIESFNRLILSRHYDGFSTTEVARKAGVGRSTFYEHFRGKEDVLQHAMKQMLEALADIAAESSDPKRTKMLVEHIGTHRPQAFRILDGPAGRTASGQLASLIETRLAISCGRNGARPVVPIALVAAQIAGAQLGLLRAWVEPAEEPCSSTELAAALHRSTRGLASLGSASNHSRS